MPETPLSPYDIFTGVCTATAANVPPVGYAATVGSDGLATATTALLGTSLTGTIDGIALATGVFSKPLQVQREGVVDKAYVTWIGAGIVEPCVVDSNGKPQRASVATGKIIGLCTRRGDIILELGQQSTAAGSGATYAASLNGLLWTLPNLGSISTPVCTAPFACAVTAQMGGDTGTVYSVTLRFRGVVELKSYVGGTRTGRLYHAGWKDPTSAVNGPQNFVQNVYRIEVEDPADYWWLNAWDGSETATDRCFSVDFSATFSIRGGSWVRLAAFTDYEYMPDIPSGAYTAAMYKNRDGSGNPITVGGGGILVSEPYDGQWLQMDVTAVA